MAEVEIEVSPQAKLDLLEISKTTRLYSPRGATRIAQRIADIFDLLKQFPGAGTVTTDPTRRLCPVPRTPYVVIYKTLPKKVRILRVVHGRQERPKS